MAGTTEHNPWAPPEPGRLQPPPTLLNHWAAAIVVGLFFLYLCPELVPVEWRSTARNVGLIGLLGLLLLGGPLSIRRTQWIATEPTYEPFDPAGPDTPPDLARFFAVEGAEIERQGFARVLTRCVVGSAPNAKSFVSLYRHPRAPEVFKIFAVEVRTTRGRVVSPVLLGTTRFVDGTEVATSNQAYPRIFPRYAPPFHGAVFPEISDATRLLAAHRAHVAEHSAGRIPVDPSGSDPLALLRNDHRQLLDHLLAQGYSWVEEATGRHRYTWKGAFLMTLRLMPPIKQFRLAAGRREARRHLARLEGP